MPAIFHTKVVDDDFDGAVQHIIEAQPNDAVVWHCKNAEEGFDGAIFHVKWAEANFDGPVWRVVGIARVIEITLKGRSPLVLPNAILAPLASLKAFGGTEQRNLPDGYLQRQFIYMMDGSYLLTDLVPTYDCKIEMDFQTTYIPTSAFGGIVGGRTATYGGLQFITNYTDKKFVLDAFGSSSADRYNSGVVAQDNTRYKFTFDNKVATLTSGGSTVFTNTFTSTGSTGAALCINAVNDNGTPTNNSMGMYLYSFKMWNGQGELVADYVPAIQKGTVPVVGFYDTVSGTFKTATAGTFAAGGEAVPTPDTPMDIVSNNGVLKARHASGLPLGYTLLDYIESSGTQYIDTGLLCGASDFEIKGNLRIDSQAPDFCPVCGLRGISRYVGTQQSRLWTCGGANGSVQELGVWFDLDFISSTTTGSIAYVDGQTVCTRADSASISNYYNICIFGYAEASTNSSSSWKKAQVFMNNQLVFNGIPAKRNSDNVIGMYDTVSETFFTNAGTGAFVAGNTVSDPVEIYADGAVETINIHGKNLFDYSIGLQLGADPTVIWTLESGGVIFALNQATGLYTVSGLATGTGGRNTLRTQTFYLPAGTYTISATNSPVINILLVNETTGNTIAQTQSTTTFTLTETTPLHFGLSRTPGITYDDSFYLQIEQGSTATTYEPYYDGGTATAEMLLSLGDYTDEQEIISGVVTRKLGVKVLDGTENWISGGGGTGVWANFQSITGVAFATADAFCSHSVYGGANVNIVDMNQNEFSLYNNGNISFKNAYTTSTDDWKTWLADQYNAGTPVIIVYPLATETTDTVTGQPMNTVAGDNTLEITQASLDDLEVEVTYLSGVVVTIEEVENAQLSNNVQVTIQ